MEIRALPLNTGKIPEAHLRCLLKAIDQTQKLLDQEAALQDDDQIHSAKSVL